MVGMRSDRARASARNLLATVYPVPNDAEFRRLRELAFDYIQEAERLEAENRGRLLDRGDEGLTACGWALKRVTHRRPRRLASVFCATRSAEERAK